MPHQFPVAGAGGAARCRPMGVALLVLLSLTVQRAAGATVSVPLRFEYPLLQELIETQLFGAAGGVAEILKDPTGCSRIELSDPQLGPDGEALKVVARVDARLGAGIPGACSELLARQGRVGFTGRPVIEPDGTAVRFEPGQTWLIGADGSELRSGALWEAADASLKAFLGRFRLDLAPYRRSLGEVLPDFLPARPAGQLQSIVESLSVSSLVITPDSLDVALDFEIEVREIAQQPEAALSGEEMLQWEERWQMMDAVLALAVKHYASATELQALRSALLEILIDSRYRLLEALAEPADAVGDPVRTWFLDSWQRLEPVIREVALEQEGQAHLLVFEVLAASDALQALDRLGPGIGLDISTDGLRRLARLINGEEGAVLLRYTEEVDPQLQQLFQQQFEGGSSEPSALRLDFSFFPRAHAASANNPAQWLARRDELDEYLPRMTRLLEETAGRIAGKHRLDEQYRPLFRKMVLATAWQESCWRQFVVEKDRLVPLRSGTGDVGLMQINERVWRGFYDMQKLRWDIDYNSDAGAEVLLDYLVKYALRQGEHKRPGGRDNLARASYSAYNGGPSQVARYRKSGVAAAHRKVDALFWEKYRQVDSGVEMRVAACLGGEPVASGTRPVTSTAQQPAAQAAVSKSTAAAAGGAGGRSGEQWLRAQDAGHFTLQLGAFSKAGFAADFIRQEAIPGPVHIVPLRQGQTTRYLVLHGSYGQRADAEATRRKFAHLQPWLRRFGDLQ